MVDRDRLISWAQNLVSMIKEAKLYEDIYIALSMQLTVSEIFQSLVDRKLVTPDEAIELGIHPDNVVEALSETPISSRSGGIVVPLRTV
jgi:hypothetical protein